MAWKENHKERMREYNRRYWEKHGNQINAKNKDYQVEYRKTNRAKRAAYMRAYRERTGGNDKQYLRDYYAKNKEQMNRRAKQYYNSNKEVFNAYARNRRARLRAAPGRHTKADVIDLFEKQKGRCATPKCTERIAVSGKNKFHVDHVVALINGGSNGPDNLQLLCKTCNLRKNDLNEAEWAKRNGLLFC